MQKKNKTNRNRKIHINNLAHKFIKKHKNIIITTSDKGNKTVMMYKTDYNNKMNNLLEDKNTYKISRIDPTN